MLKFFWLEAKWRCCDITMHAVHFWGQGKGLLVGQRVSYLWLKKKVSKRGKGASALGWKMDMQTLVHFALIQTNGSAYCKGAKYFKKAVSYYLRSCWRRHEWGEGGGWGLGGTFVLARNNLSKCQKSFDSFAGFEIQPFEFSLLQKLNIQYVIKLLNLWRLIAWYWTANMVFEKKDQQWRHCQKCRKTEWKMQRTTLWWVCCSGICRRHITVTGQPIHLDSDYCKFILMCITDVIVS